MLSQKGFLHKSLYKTEIVLAASIIAKRMVQTKKMILEIEMEIDVPTDIVQDNHRIKAVEDGLGRSISKGLYDQGVSFQIKKLTLK
jgi:hypothetical protein